MSDLFDLLGGFVDVSLDLGMGGRRGATPEPPPVPPGLPALPPDPRRITAALDAIRAHDPGFDDAALVAHARAVWHLLARAGTEHRPELARGAVSEELLGQLTAGAAAGAGEAPDAELRDAAISAASAGASLETVTVRFGTGERDEDWVFQRSASATTVVDPVAAGGHCPNCGAPLQLDASGTCPYCHTTVLAAPGWVLVARNLLRAMNERDAAALAMVAASDVPAAASPPPPPPAAAAGVDLRPLGVDAYSLLGTARETVYAVAAARSQRRPELVADRVTGELAVALHDEAVAKAAGHRLHILAFLEVISAVITGADHGPAGDRVTVRLVLSGEEYELADGSLALAEGSQTAHSWSEDWELVRAGATDPWLAASSRASAAGTAPV